MTSETMRASVLTGVESLAIEDRPVPTPAPHEVLVEVAAVGVCGSDVHYFRHGRIGDYVVTAPMILGHELSGRITAVGSGVDTGRVGQRVAIEPQHPCRRCRQCMSGHYNLCPSMRFFATPPVDGALCAFVTIDAEMAHPVPDSVSDDAAALCEPLSVGIAAAHKARIGDGSRVLVAGAGPIGLLVVQLARAYGAADIAVSDPDEGRRKQATKSGATVTFDPSVDDFDSGFDAFVDASGAPAAVVAGVRALRAAGTAVLVGSGAESMELPTQLIQNRELVLTGVFRYANTWPEAIALVDSGRVDLDSMITGRFPLEQAADALDSDRTPGSVKTVVAVS